MPVGVQAAQLIHAAGASSPGDLPHGTYAIALHAKDESELKKLSEALSKAYVVHTPIIESDAPYSGQMTAIGVFPGDRRKLKKLLSSYPLVK